MSDLLGMSPLYDKHDVVRCLQKQGKNLSSIAKDAGFSDSVCRLAFIRPQAMGEKLIADATGYQPQDLWPDRYDKKGNRTVSRGKNSNNPIDVKRKNHGKSLTPAKRSANECLGGAS